jgi:Bacterial PH domain
LALLPPAVLPIRGANAAHSMAAPRYLIPQHPTLRGPHTKEELYLLVERGSLSRGEIAVDRVSGRSHRVGDLLQSMRPPAAAQLEAPSTRRPTYQEFSGDTPWEIPGSRRKPQRAAAAQPASEDDDEHLDAEEFDDEGLEEDEDEELEEGYDDEGEEYEDEEEDTEGEEEEEEEAEQLVFRGHPSWLSFFKGLLLALLLLVAAIGSIQFGGFYWLSLGVACSSLTFTCVIIARQHRDYRVSKERVEVVWGIIGRSSKEVRIKDIRSIDVIEGGVLGFLGIGTVDFSSSGTDGVEVQFRHVRRPHRIKELVRQLQKRLD